MPTTYPVQELMLAGSIFRREFDLGFLVAVYKHELRAFSSSTTDLNGSELQGHINAALREGGAFRKRLQPTSPEHLDSIVRMFTRKAIVWH